MYLVWFKTSFHPQPCASQAACGKGPFLLLFLISNELQIRS